MKPVSLLLSLLIFASLLTYCELNERRKAQGKLSEVSAFLDFSRLYGGKHGSTCYKCHSYDIGRKQ